MADLALLIRYVAAIDGIDRIRFTTSHPVEFSDSPDRGLSPRCRNWSSFLHLPVQSGSDRILAAMKRGHTAPGIPLQDPRAARGAARHQHLVGFHRRLPRRDRGGLCRHPGADRRDRLRSQLQLHLQPPPRHPGGGLPGRCARWRSRRSAWRACRRGYRDQRPGAISRRMVGTVQRVLVEGPVAQGPGASWPGAPRTTGWSISPAPPDLIGQFVESDHHRGPAQFPARGTGAGAPALRRAAADTSCLPNPKPSTCELAPEDNTAARQPLRTASSSICARSSAGSASRSATAGISSA